MTALTLNGVGGIIFAKRLVNTITHMLIAILVYDLCQPRFSSLKFEASINWHVILSVFGFALFMAEGFLVFSPDNAYSNILQRSSNKTLHIILFTIGSIIAIAGTVVAFVWKDKFNSEHFKTFHAVTGLISLILTIIACCFGVVIVYARTILPNVRPVIFKAVHYLIGILAFIVGMVSLADKVKGTTLIVITYLITLLSIIYALIATFKSIKRSVSNY